MNLIINTLLSVLFVQLLVFSYINFTNEETTSDLTTQHIVTIIQTKVKKNTTKKTLITTNDITVSKVIEVAKKKIITPNKNKITKTIKKLSNTNSKVEEYAKKFLGNKYVWGTTGPKTFDCSGFTQKVYKQSIGITIPRVSREQAKVGKYIKFSELKKGDMVFFDTTKKHLGKVNHVGIYLNNGDFIHASSGGKRVMITNFNKKRFYKNRFLWGRRITQEHTTVATLVKSKKQEES
jgi:cell wall-associated NlpC family hydrolase